MVEVVMFGIIIMDIYLDFIGFKNFLNFNNCFHHIPQLNHLSKFMLNFKTILIFIINIIINLKIF
jgi:hypothetical protein